MTRILVVGGSGVFGSRLVEGLAATTELDIIVAGRDAGRSEAVAASARALFPGSEIGAATIDIRSVTAADLQATGAAIVVDAAGPFQNAEPILARAAIAAGLDYLDLADARDFVANFRDLDAAAKTAGVIAVTGMSSTPALSNAVLDSLTVGWRRIDRVEAGISPGNRAPRGVSVIAAILAWVGQPLRVFADGAWMARPGWSGTLRRHISGLGTRRFALADTPDLDLFVQRFSPRDTALFRAGLELRLLHDGLALAAWLPRLGIVRSLVPLARLFRRVADCMRPFGSDRGGMVVEAAGRDGDDSPAIARWTLVAESMDGPYIPALPALAWIRKLAGDRAVLAPGAYASAGLLPLAVIAAEFGRFRIRTETDVHHPVAPFEAALGREFGILPGAVKTAHRSGPVTRLTGAAEIRGADSTIGGLVARLFGFPFKGEDVPVRVTMRLEADGTELWERDFGGRRLRSQLAPAGPGIVSERFGPFRFQLALQASADGLSMRVAGWSLGPLPLPILLAPKSDARESVDTEYRFRFDVPVGLPLIGRLVHYRGWLKLTP